jgi:hypothetical protein
MYLYPDGRTKWLSPTTCHFENIRRKSNSCGHAHLHYVYKHPTKYWSCSSKTVRVKNLQLECIFHNIMSSIFNDKSILSFSKPVSYKRQDILTLREHLGLPRLFSGVRVADLFFYAPATKSRGHINLPLCVRPDIDAWFFQLYPPTVLELQL